MNYPCCKECGRLLPLSDCFGEIYECAHEHGWIGSFFEKDGRIMARLLICPYCQKTQQKAIHATKAALSRREILAKAEQCICADRETQYGSPENNFTCIANLWNAYKPHLAVTAQDVGIMLALLKIGRIASGQTKEDNFVDLAGYAACAGEIALSQPI